MRVLIDGGIPGSRGYMRVLRGILSAGRLPLDVEPYLLCSPEFPDILGPLEERVGIIKEPVLSSSSRPRRVRWWLREYPRLVRRLAPDVILHPFGFTRGDSGGVPRVVRATSMLPFDLREIGRYGLSRRRLVLLRQRQRSICGFRKADGVIFLSDHSRREILRQVPGIKNSTVVPNGLEPNFRTETPSQRSLGSLVRLLYVSTILLYKHQWHLVEAVSSLREELGTDLRLTLVGGGEPVAQRKLARRIEELGAASFVSTTGDMPLDDIAAVYREADVFVFASSCEGHPNTLIEAMANPAPIACSNRASMPDLLKDGGVYFDPEKPKTIAAAVRRLLESPDLRHECSTRAHEYSCAYAWENTARGTYDFLREVSGSRR